MGLHVLPQPFEFRGLSVGVEVVAIEGGTVSLKVFLQERKTRVWEWLPISLSKGYSVILSGLSCILRGSISTENGDNLPPISSWECSAGKSAK